MKQRCLRLALLALCMPAWAQQKVELGVSVGGGAVGYVDDGATPSRAVVGVEVCAWCMGRYALYGEYSHWLPADSGALNYTGSDIFGAGLRIQGTRKVRPFFDIGLAGLNHRVDLRSVLRSSVNSAGVGLGGGVRIAAGEHFYIRPQVRLYLLGGSKGGYVGASVAVGVGWRF